jgi:hypothetical protein
MKPKILVVVFVSFLILPSQLSAFDGQRKGFILGGGVGLGYLAGSEPVIGAARISPWSPAANFKIGYAPSNTLEISYTNAAAGIYEIYDDADSLFGVNAFALTKYFEPDKPGFFITGGIGWAYKIQSENDGGLGLIGGVGYELGRPWSLQGDVVYMSARNLHYAAIRLTLNFLAF